MQSRGSETTDRRYPVVSTPALFWRARGSNLSLKTGHLKAVVVFVSSSRQILG